MKDITLESMEKTQTAVEWLEEEFIALQNYGINELGLFSKAKAMEKEQIKNAWVNAWQESFIDPLDYKFYEPEAEEYYHKTYGEDPNRS